MGNIYFEGGIKLTPHPPLTHPLPTPYPRELKIQPFTPPKRRAFGSIESSTLAHTKILQPLAAFAPEKGGQDPPPSLTVRDTRRHAQDTPQRHARNLV